MSNMERLLALTKGSMDTLFRYACLDPAKEQMAYQSISAYLKLPNKNAASDEARLIRKRATVGFYELYKACFFASIDEDGMPIPVMLFLYFGYVDENSVSDEHILSLLKLVSEYKEHEHVFPFYKWLLKIAMGQASPSVNDFSMDYDGTIREQRKRNEITADEEKKAMRNIRAKVEFEIDNMFQSVMRMVSQSVLTFCPVLTDSDLVKPPEKMYLRCEDLYESIMDVRKVDHSLFFRDMMYANKRVGIDRAEIKTEVLPNVILMPCVGSRGAMWQEIEGANRQTPARFIMPALLTEEVEKTVQKVCGHFRWEMCKRSQGARWMDISDKSLTSEYCDYIAGYRKNAELSTDVREKIKIALTRGKNDTKSVFIEDYVSYLQYESKGAIRLNKVARRILYEYCPFSKEVLAGPVGQNPLYSDIIARKVTKMAHELHLNDIVLQRIEKSKNDIPDELWAYRRYLEG